MMKQSVFLRGRRNFPKIQIQLIKGWSQHKLSLKFKLVIDEFLFLTGQL